MEVKERQQRMAAISGAAARKTMEQASGVTTSPTHPVPSELALILQALTSEELRPDTMSKAACSQLSSRGGGGGPFLRE